MFPEVEEIAHTIAIRLPQSPYRERISMSRSSPPVGDFNAASAHYRCRHLQEPLDQARMAESAASQCPSLMSVQQKRARCPAQSRQQSMPDKRRSRAQSCTIVAASSVEIHIASLIMLRHPQTPLC